MNKHRANRLGFAILLAFFRDRGRFPRAESEVEIADKRKEEGSGLFLLPFFVPGTPRIAYAS
jgi:hypothetical protein